jgi:sortase A
MDKTDKRAKQKRLFGRIGSTILIVLGLIILLYPTLTNLYARTSQAAHKEAVKQAFQEIKKLPDGAVTYIEIPRINYEAAVYEGVTTPDLRRGPGHYPKTALPGQSGNCVIAGHRIPSVFKDLDQLQYDDPFYLYGKNGKYLYRVVSIRFVKPTDTQVILPIGLNTATLITCHPYLKPTGRLVIQGALTKSFLIANNPTHHKLEERAFRPLL